MLGIEHQLTFRWIYFNTINYQFKTSCANVDRNVIYDAPVQYFIQYANTINMTSFDLPHLLSHLSPSLSISLSLCLWVQKAMHHSLPDVRRKKKTVQLITSSFFDVISIAIPSINCLLPRTLSISYLFIMFLHFTNFNIILLCVLCGCLTLHVFQQLCRLKCAANYLMSLGLFYV